MKTNLYYFSATGNCLTLARRISEKLEDCQLISIPQALQSNEVPEADAIGIICPVYMHNMPVIVADFIKTLHQPKYLFFIYAGEGGLGNGIKAAKKQFAANNLKLSSLFNIIMPGNYTPYGYPSEEEQQKRFELAYTRVNEIVDAVQNQKEFWDSNNTSFFKSNIHPGIFYALGYTQIHKLGQTFTVDSKCDGCGVCVQVCPVNNITLKDNKPTWNTHCQFCYGCLQWCPKEAIQNGKKTPGVKRYHHPDIKVSDIIAASKK